MHETFMAQRVAEELERIVQRHGAARLTRAVLKVGPLRQVVPDLLAFAMQAALKDTASAGAEIVIEPCPPRGRCRACGKEFEIYNWRYVCPACDSGQVETHGGDELIIETVTLESDECKAPSAK